MKGLSMLTVLLTVVFAASLTPAAGPPSDWSSFAGDGDFVPARQGLELTDDLVNIRMAWKNATHTGTGKAGGGTALEVQRAGFEPAYGQVSNLIVGDGVVFCSWSQPSGDVTAPRESINERYYDQHELTALKNGFFRIDADWRTMAMDAETGETLWEAREESASIHFLSTKRGHSGISGAYGDGMYVTVTVLGEVFAYDADNGERRWKKTLEKRHDWAEEWKAEHLKKRRMPHARDIGRSGAVIAAGVVVVPDLAGGMLGLDPETGDELWHVPDALKSWATPQPWEHEGKTWLLCNGPGDSKITSVVRLVDPETGEVAWAHKSGSNRSCLIFGERYLVLDVPGHPSGRDEDWHETHGIYAAYRLSPEGLTEAWRFEDAPQNIVDYRAGNKAAIRDGVLYAITGKRKSGHRRLRGYDVTTGKLLDEAPVTSNILSQPAPVEDKLFIVKDGAHSGAFAGLVLYQLEDDGRRVRRFGNISYKNSGIERIGGYSFLKTTPYYDGRLFMRGLMGIYGLDLREVTDPMARLELEGAWAGSPVPVRCRLFANEDGMVQTAKARPPAASDLGVVHSTGRRWDGWTHMRLHDDLSITRGGSAKATLDMISHSWDVEISLGRENGEWTGTWERTIPALDHKPTMKGKIDNAESGYDARVYPTGWLKHQPITKMGDLPEGHRRLIMTLPGVLPKGDRAEHRSRLVLCLDHDGENFVSGVGGAFSYNQAWHEVDVSGLEMTDDGFEGELIVIVNPDPWWAPNVEEGTAIVGRAEIDATFGEADENGLREVNGTWSVNWGEPLNRFGRIIITKLRNMD
jgi:outer membrane protein assembly factor BamB